jgi:glycosyltransferase involved in cell wall biosynthesis
VLHVIPVLWSGAGEVVTHLCERQVRRYDVTVVTSAYRGALADWPAYRRRLRDAGVRLAVIDTFSREPSVFWAAVESLGALTRAWRPDVVHTHAGVPAAAFACCEHGARIRHIAQMYSWGAGRPAWMNRMDTWGFRQADRVLCSARRYQALLREGGVPPRRLAFLRLGVRVEALDAALRRHRAAPGVDTGRLRVGFVGRIEPRKGQLDLIAAFSLVRRRRPDAHLDLVGPVADPIYAARCRAEAERLEVADHITWRGHVKEVAPLLVGWQLFVSLSADEGQGLAVQEAMAAGVPVVVRQAPGVEDYVSDGRTGIVAAGPQPRRVAAAIARAVDDPGALARIAAAGARLIRERYSWAQCEATLERLYHGPG